MSVPLKRVLLVDESLNESHNLQVRSSALCISKLGQQTPKNVVLTYVRNIGRETKEEEEVGLGVNECLNGLTWIPSKGRALGFSRYRIVGGDHLLLSVMF